MSETFADLCNTINAKANGWDATGWSGALAHPSLGFFAVNMDRVSRQHPPGVFVSRPCEGLYLFVGIARLDALRRSFGLIVSCRIPRFVWYFLRSRLKYTIKSREPLSPNTRSPV